VRLTDPRIRSLVPPKSGVFVVNDDLFPGFGVRVSTGGTKSFVLTYGPRRQRETLGKVGVLSLHDARKEAKRRLAEYTLGKEKPRAIAWDDAAREFLADKARKLKPRTHFDYTYILGKHFKYGPTKLTDLTPYDLNRNLDRLSKTPAEQQHAYVILRAFVRWAHRKHYFDRNPMERMQAPQRYIARDRILTMDELRKVWLAAGDDTFGRIIKLLILTGQRRGEITKLTGSMVGDDTITLPKWLAKNSRQHTFPIGPMAKELLGPPIPPQACYFPALGRKTPFDGFSKCKPKLEQRCGVSEWTIHDLRRTFASGMASLGVTLPVIERFLNHISGSFGGIVGVYQRYDFMPEMREAIAKWENHVRSMVLAPD
jgi:integrase